MCYYFYMNKDVIYIEPEDDITDIITKIENSKEKIVALVPPKKAGVFRSAVNIKLMAKSSKVASKTIVLVTVDPSIVKLAASVRIPVTKNLQSAPAIPDADVEIEETTKEEVLDDPDELIEEEIDKAQTSAKQKDPKEADAEDEGSEDDEDDDKASAKKKNKGKKEKKSDDTTQKSGNPIINWIKSHKKTTIFGCVSLIALIAVLVWAFTVAPAVDITVGISTEPNNFAEMVTFTTSATEENVAEGKFYLEEKKLESVAEVNFEATGQKNNGEKATGTLIIKRNFFMGDSVEINKGSIFTFNGLNYVATESISLGWSGWGSGSSPSEMKSRAKSCDNASTAVMDEYCTKSAKINIEAAEGGTAYNIPASSDGWGSVVQVDIKSDGAITGGTDDIITVVEQGDIEKAKNEMKASNEEENKAKLLSGIGEDVLILEDSFSQDTAAAIATPAAGEEVKDGVTPSLKATTTATVYVVDKSKLEQFITEKAKLEDDQKVYEIKNPYIENFVKGDTGYAGKLKAVYAVGPKVTDNDVLEMVKGKGIGDARHDLSSINGITSVTIDTSYPWVSVIPSDSNKITIKMEVKKSDDKESQQQNSDTKGQ